MKYNKGDEVYYLAKDGIHKGKILLAFDLEDTDPCAMYLIREGNTFNSFYEKYLFKTLKECTDFVAECVANFNQARYGWEGSVTDEGMLFNPTKGFVPNGIQLVEFRPKRGRPKGSKNKTKLTDEEKIEAFAKEFEANYSTHRKKQNYRKTCNKCGLKKPTDEFDYEGRYKMKRARICRECGSKS